MNSFYSDLNYIEKIYGVKKTKKIKLIICEDATSIGNNIKLTKNLVTSGLINEVKFTEPPTMEAFKEFLFS